MYVAMTRARDFLCVSWPLRYYHRWYGLSDRHSYAQISRFLSEDVCDTLEHIDLMQENGWDEDFPVDPEDVDDIQDIPGEMRSMWD